MTDGSAARVSDGRFLVAAAIGHLLASYVATFVFLVGVLLRHENEPDPNRPGFLNVLVFLPLGTAFLSIFTAVLFIPFSIAGGILAYAMVFWVRPRPRLRVMLATGAILGSLGSVLQWTGILASIVTHLGRMDGKFDFTAIAGLELSGCSAGMAYAWTIWWFCLRSKNSDVEGFYLL